MVVLMYSTYSVGEDTGSVGFMHYVIGFTTPFRMPEFFLLSGLFLSNVITRPFARYIDRRTVHYLYFYLLWVAIHIAVKVALGQGDPIEAGRQVLFALIEPYGVLWFIYMLGVFGLVARIFWQFKAPQWLVLTLAACLQIAAIQSPSYIVTQFAAYFVYFYAGYVAAPIVFRFVDEVRALPQLATFALICWALLNGALVFAGGSQSLPEHTVMGIGSLPGVHLLLGFAGAFAVCAAGALLMKLPRMEWLLWLGEHSLIIYLAFALPMSAVRIALLKTGLVTEPGLLSLIVFVVATVTPVILYVAVKWAGFGHFLFDRPKWAHLPGSVQANRIERVTRASPTPAE
jgi:uncharacterized membrane protein YcfT